MPGNGESFYRPDMPTLLDVLPRNVAAERARRGWLQKDLAKRLGWGGTKVSELETGARRVQVDELGPLCRALGVPLWKLAEGTDEEELEALGLTAPD
jgi:transcriptional regulator with XRE-family HTH domain